MNDQAVKDLIREIAAEHGIAIDRDDPILIVHTATRKILGDAVQQAQQNVDQALARHRSELELASGKWQEDCGRSASAVVQRTKDAIEMAVSEALSEASGAATLRLQQALEQHEKAVARSALTSTLAAAAALLAAAAVVLSRCG